MKKLKLADLYDLFSDYAGGSEREVKVWMEDTGARRPIHSVLVEVGGDNIYQLSAEQPQALLP